MLSVRVGRTDISGTEMWIQGGVGPGRGCSHHLVHLAKHGFLILTNWNSVVSTPGRPPVELSAQTATYLVDVELLLHCPQCLLLHRVKVLLLSHSRLCGWRWWSRRRWPGRPRSRRTPLELGQHRLLVLVKVKHVVVAERLELGNGSGGVCRRERGGVGGEVATDLARLGLSGLFGLVAVPAQFRLRGGNGYQLHVSFPGAQ